MQQLSFRLHPGDLLKEEIERRVVAARCKSGVLLSVVGALSKTVLRMAGATPTNQPIKEWNEPMEIVSGTGAVSMDGCHIHISISDTFGNVHGGHLKGGCVVDVTAEVVIGMFDDVEFKRGMDEKTGFKELIITMV